MLMNLRIFFIINELQAPLEAKNVLIGKLKEHIANLKGKITVKSVQNVHNSNVVTSNVYKLDLPPLSPCINNNMATHVDYLKHTQANTDILCEIIEDARELRPLKRLGKLGVSCSTVASRSKPTSNTNNNRISQTSRSNKKKNKVEDHPKIARWVPMGRNFTIVENVCPLTRITSTKAVPPKKNIPPKLNANVPNPEIKVFHRSTTVAKLVKFNDTPSILGTKPSNNSEPMQN
ncbi:hypothetical protein Tco_1208535 [Tanacetum coccineum]